MKKSISNVAFIAKSIVSDEEGGEVMEWVLIAGLIIVATIVTVAAFGRKVLAKWTSVNASM